MAEEASVHAARLARRLKRAGFRIATAESCTGGLLASTLTDISGSSQWFEYGWVTYANEAKFSQLGIDPELIDNEDAAGSVSNRVALAMASGAQEVAQCEMAISITGIAGPTGGTETKEVGLVHVGVIIEEGFWGKAANFGGGDRRANKESFVNFALRTALQFWDRHFSEDEEEQLSADKVDEDPGGSEEEEEQDAPPKDLNAALNVMDGGDEWSEDVGWKDDSTEVPADPSSLPGAEIDWTDEDGLAPTETEPRDEVNKSGPSENDSEVGEGEENGA